MALQISSFTAFRIFGTFQWPPIPGRLTEQDCDDGAVEIHYVLLPTGDHLAAYLRWLPRGDDHVVSTPFTPDPSNTLFIHSLSADELANRFKTGDEVVLRLDNPTGAVVAAGERLLFRGARVFDQFSLDPANNCAGPTADPTPDLRWVLASSYQERNHTFYSEIVVGRETDAPKTSGCSIRFNLALPTLVPQRVLDGEPVKATSFSVNYASVIPADSSRRTVAMTNFMAGSSATGAVHDIELGNLEGTLGDNARLGSFGLCCVSGDKKKFINFPQGNFTKGNYWLDDQRIFIDHVLSRLADVGQMPPDKFIFAHTLEAGMARGRGEIFDSIRFQSAQPGGDRTTIMLFRTGILGQWNWADKPGDIQVEFGKFLFVNPFQPSQLIETGANKLYVELELIYTLASKDIWNVGSFDNPTNPKVVVRVGFSSSIDEQAGSTNLGTPPAATKARITISDLFGDAIHSMRLTRIGLRNTEAPLPQSALPDVNIESADNIRFSLTGTIPASFDRTGALDWGKRPARGNPWAGLSPRLSVWPDGRLFDSERRNNFDPIGTFSVQVAPYSLTYSSNGGSVTPLPVTVTADPAAPNGISNEFCQFRVSPSGGSALLMGRLGGLEFTSTSGIKNDETSSDYSYWRFGPRAAITDQSEPSTSYSATQVDLRLRLAIDLVAPVGVDIPRSDRSGRARPLLIPVGAPTGPLAASSPSYVLDLRETVSADADRQLTAQLLVMTPGTNSTIGRGSYVVIGEAPFSITKFRSQSLSDRGGPDNDYVATFDSDTREWQFKRVANFYHYELPPQAVGESMDKPRRLDILDSDETSKKIVQRAAEPTTDNVLHRRAVEFRLTPSAELWIQPSDVERNYFLPESASYEIFRQTGAYGLGAALQSLRGEFLYGLTVGVDTTREIGPARGARVAEIEALIGLPPGEPRASNPDPGITGRWRSLSAAIARRPERLEIWNRDFDGASNFSPTQFGPGVTFALRSTAVHSEALENPDPNSKPWPQGPGIPRISSHGLAGGALWPIESANLYRLLLRSPGSDGGTISRIALSPGGGDADQKALFLNRQVSINSETRNGFVQRHKVEVIGRIGAHWHRAKHVIVYERTASPSAQFAPESTDPGYLKASRYPSRRPVLRKVSEYIELLQPERFYPDFPVASAASSGFLSSIRHNHKTINVDSAWSEEVGDYGWRIPLWNPDAASKRPQVYPRPDVSFIAHSEGDGDQPLGAQECTNPENIYFFADFATGGDDTDAWPSRVGIDFTALAVPTFGQQPPLGDFSNADGNTRQGNVLRIPRGHGRFTWRLAPPARKTAINSGRAGQSIYAGVESVTFMRSNPVIGSAFESTLTQIQRDADTHAAAPPANKLPIWLPDRSAPTQLADLGQALKDYRTAAAGGDSSATTTAATKYLAELQNFKARLNTDIRPYVQDAQNGLQNLNSLSKMAQGLPSRCEKLADDLVGSLQRKQMEILERINSCENYAYSLVQRVANFSIDQLKENLNDQIKREIDAAFPDGGSDRLNLGQSLEKARNVIRDFQSDISAVHQGLQARLGKIRNAYDDGKPWSPERLKLFLGKIEAERAGILADVHSAIAEAQMRLATELDDISSKVGAVLSEAVAMLDADDSPLKAKLAGIDAFLRRTLETVIDHINLLIAGTSFTDAGTTLSNLAARYPAEAQSLNDARAFVVSLQAVLPSVRDDLTHIQSSLHSDIAALCVDVSKAISKVKPGLLALSDLVSKLTAISTSALSQGAADLKKAVDDLSEKINQSITSAVSSFVSIGTAVNGIILGALSCVSGVIESEVIGRVDAMLQLASDTAGKVTLKFTAITDAFSPTKLKTLLHSGFVQPLIDGTFGPLGHTIDLNLPSNVEWLNSAISGMSDTAAVKFKDFVDKDVDQITSSLLPQCRTLGCSLSDIGAEMAVIGNTLATDLQSQIDKLNGIIGKPDDLIKLAGDFERDVRTISNDLASSYTRTTNYAEKVIDTVGNLGHGGLAAAPSNILKLYAAVASAPDLPNLDFARNRIGYYYGKLQNVIDTTPVEAWFGRLGDELKAMGLSMPFSQLSDRILPDDLSAFDIGRVLKNFGGIKFDQLFNGYKLPSGASDAIKVTHAFNKKAARAWVQIDIDLPLPDRQSLFTVGPFQLDFVGAHMVGQVHLEASKDSDSIEQTGQASVATDIEAVVAGQTMVSLRKMTLHYERSSGLRIDFDPKNIRLNSVFQFVQDTLGSLFPDDIGGLKIIKQNGIPVGIEHDFSMPPIALMFGTSGVSNIQISNCFSLIAFPDFLIADRFCLSKPEMPFLFSIFVIGGTGYITVDTEYRPFDAGQGLMVMVEAAAGGSAAIGFAFGPISGSVFIALSVALGYRKVVGTNAGGGLTIALVLVVAGNVSVAGIVTVYIGLQLRLSYRDTGQIDAAGTLVVEIKISSFFKLRARANAQYKLRDGHSQTTTSASVDASLSGPADRAQKLLSQRG
jgi:hypothetical protein